MMMFMYGKNKKQVRRIAIYTLLFIVSMCLVSTPKSYSAYYDKDEETLVYKAQLYNLYNESNLALDQALETTARLKMTFKTNKAVTSGEIDTYEINIPSACKFNSVDTNATRTKVSDTKYIIKYEGDINRDYLNTLYFTCDVDISEPKIEFTAKINETIGDTATNKPFIYAKATYSELIDDYISQIPPDIDDSEVVPETSAYEAFVAWYEAYGKRAGYSNEVNEYVKSVFKGENEFNNKDNYTALPGLKITYDETKKEYTFSILDNFIGYARTYYRYSNGLASPEAGSATLYFSTDNKNSLNTAIKEYLKKYVFTKDDEAVTLVDKYIKDKGGIYSVIFENNDFTGIECFEYNVATKDAGVRIYKETILTVAKAASEKKVQVAFDNYWMMIAALNDGLVAAYSDVLSSDIITNIINKPNIRASITTNCTSDADFIPVTTPKISFIDSFIYQFDGKTIIIKISTDLDNNPGYTTVEIVEIEAPANTEIIFTNTNDSEFTININGSNKTEVDKIVALLDEYFNTTTNDSDITVKTDTSNEYSIEYKVTKLEHVRTVSTITDNVSTTSADKNNMASEKEKTPGVSSDNQTPENSTNNSESTNEKTNITDSNSTVTSDDVKDDDKKISTNETDSNNINTTSDKVVANEEDVSSDSSLNNDNSDNNLN